MIRYFLHSISWFAVVVFEFGFMHSLSLPWSLAPIGICIGIYQIFNLKPYIGLLWIMGMGLAIELHSLTPGGEILIAAFLGWLLIYIIDQHITHMSFYSAVASAGVMMFLWSVLSVVFGVIFGNIVPLEVWLTESVKIAIAGSVTMTVIMITFPLAKKVIRQNVRFS
jgi:hypothetical protein